jgi:hypothetical protein
LTSRPAIALCATISRPREKSLSEPTVPVSAVLDRIMVSQRASVSQPSL